MAGSWFVISRVFEYRAPLFLLFLLALSFAGEFIPYISPGLMLAWNSRRVQTVNIKIGAGVAYNPSHHYAVDMGFAALTFGKRTCIEHTFSDLDYRYLDIEGGLFKGFFVGGSGIGLAFYKEENGKTVPVPKISFFAGDVLFVRTDIVFRKVKKDVDVGGMLVLPINQYVFKAW